MTPHAITIPITGNKAPKTGSIGNKACASTQTSTPNKITKILLKILSIIFSPAS